jgi:peptidoglycan hydrolase CwlO-like protein
VKLGGIVLTASNMKDILLVVIPSILAYIFGYRMNNADLCGKRLDELEKSINVYNHIIDDMSNKIEGLTAEINKLEAQIQELLQENKKLKNKNSL